MQILVLNCGSSSVKYRLFDMAREEAIARGAVEKIGQPEPELTHRWDGGELSESVAVRNHTDALMHIRDLLLDPARGGVRAVSDITAVGHRVVHGGERFVASMRITDEVERIIETYATLAPLHNPPNLAGIQAARKFFPEVPHVAVFDTAFHRHMPPAASVYPIPYEWSLLSR